MLGNRFETLYLPSDIVLVEGKCDYQFIDSVIAVNYPNHQIRVIAANGDARIKEVLNIARGLFTDIQKSPYRDRICVVLDSVHSKRLPTEISAMGIAKENIVVWEKNGIGFYYPDPLVSQLFGVGSDLQINKDVVSGNGISYSKNELVGKIVASLQADTPMLPEFQEKILNRIDKSLGLVSSHSETA